MMSMGECCYDTFVKRFGGNAIDLSFCLLNARVSRFMNITLTDAVFIDRCGKYQAYDNFMVPARMIKFIQVPGQVI